MTNLCGLFEPSKPLFGPSKPMVLFEVQEDYTVYVPLSTRIRLAPSQAARYIETAFSTNQVICALIDFFNSLADSISEAFTRLTQKINQVHPYPELRNPNCDERTLVEILVEATGIPFVGDPARLPAPPQDGCVILTEEDAAFPANSTLGVYTMELIELERPPAIPPEDIISP